MGKSSGAATLRPSDLEREYGIPQQTSANWRSVGRGPDFVRVSARMILYRREAVEKFLSDRTVKVAR